MPVRLLESSFANDAGDIIRPIMINAGDVYYYDPLGRYCYLKAEEEGKTWKFVSDGNGARDITMKPDEATPATLDLGYGEKED